MEALKKIVFFIAVGFLLFAQNLRAEGFINPSELPKNLYVAICFSDPDFFSLPMKKRRYITKLLEEDLQLTLYSKGYNVKRFKTLRKCSADYLVNRFQPSDGEGILAVNVTRINLTYVLVAQNYSVAADVSLIGKGGKVLGRWYSEAGKGELNIPLSLTDVARVFIKALTHNEEQIIYNLLQVFVHKLALQLPTLPEAAKAIKVYFVNWFIGDPQSGKVKKILKRGDVVSLLVEAQPGLKGYLILDGIRREGKSEPIKVDLSHASSSPQIYIARYTVREGDEGRDVAFTAVLINKYGDKIKLTYPRYVDIDGVPPLPPTNLRPVLVGENVQLSWDILSYSGDFDHFSIYRKNENGGKWELIGETRETRFVDKNVSPGNIYLYKVVSVDKAGNISDDSISPVVEVVIPLQRVIYLQNKELKGYLPPATYIVADGVKVPRGESLIAKYVKFVFQKPLVVQGEFYADKTKFVGNPNEAVYSPLNIYPKSDCLYVEGGKAIISASEFSQCKKALFVKYGSATVEKTVFGDNDLNVLSYEPFNTVLKEVSFGSNEITDFKLRGKLILKSFVYNDVKVNVNPEKYYFELQNWIFQLFGQKEKVKKLLEDYTPIFVKPPYPDVDRKLVKLCTDLNDKTCLKDYLPALVKLYPDDVFFLRAYIATLPKDEACRILKAYRNKRDVYEGLKDLEVILRCEGR